MGVHHRYATPTTPVLLLSLIRRSRILHHLFILHLFLLHGQNQLLLQRAEQRLVAIQLHHELLIGRSHVPHLLINQMLHLGHIRFIFVADLVKVVVKNLECLGKGVDFIRHFVAQISNSRDILENLILFAPEMLNQSLDIR